MFWPTAGRPRRGRNRAASGAKSLRRLWIRSTRQRGSCLDARPPCLARPLGRLGFRCFSAAFRIGPRVSESPSSGGAKSHINAFVRLGCVSRECVELAKRVHRNWTASESINNAACQRDASRRAHTFTLSSRGRGLKCRSTSSMRIKACGAALPAGNSSAPGVTFSTTIAAPTP